MRKFCCAMCFALLLLLTLSTGASASLGNYSNGNDMFSNGTIEFYSNANDEDKLYKINLADRTEEKILDEHIISILNENNYLYLLAYDNNSGNSNLLKFDMNDFSYTLVKRFDGLVANIAKRDSVLYYIIDQNVVAYNLDDNSTETILDSGNIDLIYFTDYTTLMYYTKMLDDNYIEQIYSFNEIPEPPIRASDDTKSLMASSSYSPRLTAPATNDPYYTTWNVFHTSGYGMVTNNGNCTCYAYGRSYENLGSKPNLCTGNAGTWYSYNINNGYYLYGSTPALGAVAVWGQSGAAGHVAVVEIINGDNVTTSESGWQSYYFKTITRSASNSNFSASSSYSFLGFIYVLGNNPTPPTISNGTFIVRPDGSAYRIAGGAPIWISSWDYYGGVQAHTVVTDAQFWALPQYPSDGTLVNDLRTGRVYEFIENGHPRWVFDWSHVDTSGGVVDVDAGLDNMKRHPCGYIDSITGGNGAVTVSGWGLDGDNPDAQIDVVVSIGGDVASANAEIHTGIIANTFKNLEAVYHGIGNYHGFNTEIKTSKTGLQNVYVYLKNLPGSPGGDTYLGSIQVNIIDSTPPVISNVQITDVSSAGYTVSCTVTDNDGVSHVAFPTWTASNNQDDLISDWTTNPKAAGTAVGNVYTYRVNISDHNNEHGLYHTHIYAWDSYGNQKYYRLDVLVDGSSLVPSKTLYLKGHKYELYDQFGIYSWRAAKTFCELMGGHLATVTSSEENDVIVNLIYGAEKYYYCLGATDAEQEGVWKWVTGEEFSYSNWYPGQPDNNGGEHYLGIYRSPSLWNDFPDVLEGFEAGIICEYVMDPTPPVITVNDVTGTVGQDVSISIDISDGSAICDGNFNIEYDKEALQIVSVTAGALLDGKSVEINKEYSDTMVRVSFAGTEEISNSGTLVNATFKVLNSAETETDITVSDCNMYNFKGKAITTTINHGTVTISKATLFSAAVTAANTTGRPGDTVNMVVSITDNPGLAGFKIYGDYDTTALTLNSITPGAVLSDGTFTPNLAMTTEHNFLGHWYHTTDVTANGALFTLNFTIATDAAEGSYPVTLSYSAADTIQVNSQPVHLDITSGSITVSGTLLGDILIDGLVNNKDAVKLARYLAELETLSEEQLAAADVDGNGHVNTSDIIKLARYLVGLETTLGN